MRKLLLLALLLPSLGWAQSEEDFADFGQRLFAFVTDSVPQAPIDFIRDREYHELIDRQPLSSNQKSIAKHHVNETIGETYRRFEQSLIYLQESYREEKASGAELEYLTTRYEPLQNSEDTYAMQTIFIYRSGRVQSRVKFNVDVAWLGDRMVVISPIKEDF